MDKRKLLRRRAAQRSRDANYRDRKRMVVPVSEGCNHVWRMDGVCMKCEEPVNKRVCQGDL